MKSSLPYIIHRQKNGKVYYLHIDDPDNPSKYLKWVTKVSNASLFGSNIDFKKYMFEKFGINEKQLQSINFEFRYLTIDEINEITDKYL